MHMVGYFRRLVGHFRRWKNGFGINISEETLVCPKRSFLCKTYLLGKRQNLSTFWRGRYVSVSVSVYVNVCIYIYIHVYVFVYMYICLCIYMSLYICLCIYIYMSMYICLCLCLCICMCICMCICICMCMYMYVYVYVYMYMCICICVYIYIYMHIHISIHIYAHGWQMASFVSDSPMKNHQLPQDLHLFNTEEREWMQVAFFPMRRMWVPFGSRWPLWLVAS